LIKAVIVNIDFTADFLLGFRDIRRLKLFKYPPDLVEDSNPEEEEPSESPNEEHGIKKT
jgi:hypothetical protein